MVFASACFRHPSLHHFSSYSSFLSNFDRPGTETPSKPSESCGKPCIVSFVPNMVGKVDFVVERVSDENTSGNLYFQGRWAIKNPNKVKEVVEVH